MTLEQRGDYFYGDTTPDLLAEMQRFAEENGYPIDAVAQCRCQCGAKRFQLLVDEHQGVGARVCEACGNEHVMGDGGHYVDEAELEECECLCGSNFFELAVGLSRYWENDETPSDDVRWFYIGGRCPECRLLGCYADWKNEFEGFQELLDNV